MAPTPPLHASRDYAANEEFDVPACLHRPRQPLSIWARGSDDAVGGAEPGWGPEEHRIDAFQLRNEASFINDFRDEVAWPNAAMLSRRRPSCAVVTVIIRGQVHALLWATKPIAEGREVLLDYGEQYWQVWHSDEADYDSQASIDSRDVPDEAGDGGYSTTDDDAELQKMEAFEPVDRATARRIVEGDKDGWDWADISKPPPQSSLPIEPITCSTSVSAVRQREGPNQEEDEDEVIFPACLFRSTTTEHREELLAAVKHWLNAGAGPQDIVIGRLLSSAHPAVAAAAKYASTKQGVAAVQLGVFATRSVARCQILCEYQGVRLSSPVGCSPWRQPIAAGRTSYMLALATVAHWGGMRQALRSLPRLQVDVGTVGLTHGPTEGGRCPPLDSIDAKVVLTEATDGSTIRAHGRRENTSTPHDNLICRGVSDISDCLRFQAA